ncbi:hypothetical protein HDU97_001594 [Phlyctochytrium planicorne]|nr:hypothetical protein HDU97_001594 [Phlyctochytrium planicorne]
MTSFIPIPANSDFPIANIPFGIISSADDASHRPATIVGNHVIDLRSVAKAGLFDGPLMKAVAVEVFSQPTLNSFMSLTRPHWLETRQTLQRILSTTTPSQALQSAVLPAEKTINHLPAQIGDYTDFYASKEHATNVGIMFRGKENALMPNWVHLPVGYHGRASSVVISGTPIRRPCGLVQDFVTKAVGFSQSKKLDYEVEVAFFVGGKTNELGDRIDITQADQHIFGMVLMNDWSARDIQAYEYVPLGPFLGKNFGTTISPWIVTLDALEELRVPQPVQDPVPAEYLLDKTSKVGDAYDINLETKLIPDGAQTGITTCKTNFKYMYWSFKQQLAHHTVNGCNVRPGDLLASGTISGADKTALGSLLEASVNGKEPLDLQGADGKTYKRSFIEDGDSIVMTGYGVNKSGVRIGFGECKGQVLRASFGGLAPKV